MIDNNRYSVQLHDDLPIMLTAFKEQFVFAQDAQAYSVDVKEVLNAQESPVFYLLDLTKWHVMSFNDLIEAAALAARGKESNFHHPMNRHTLIVTNDQGVSMTAEGLTSDAYGNANIKVFNSVEDAMNYAKSEL